MAQRTKLLIAPSAPGAPSAPIAPDANTCLDITIFDALCSYSSLGIKHRSALNKKYFSTDIGVKNLTFIFIFLQKMSKKSFLLKKLFSVKNPFQVEIVILG